MIEILKYTHKNKNIKKLDVLIIIFLLTPLPVGLTNGAIGTINGTNASTNGKIDTIGTIGCRETFRVLWLPMVPLALVKFPMVQLGESRTHAIYSACVHGSTNRIPISFKVIPMVPLVIPLVSMVMPMVPFALPMVLLVPLVSQWCHWLPMVPLVKLLMVSLGEPQTEPMWANSNKAS